MSSFGMEVRHKTTGEIKSCMCIDDHFGRHIYGYFIDGKEPALTDNELDKNWERVRK